MGSSLNWLQWLSGVTYVTIRAWVSTKFGEWLWGAVKAECANFNRWQVLPIAKVFYQLHEAEKFRTLKVVHTLKKLKYFSDLRPSCILFTTEKYRTFHTFVFHLFNVHCNVIFDAPPCLKKVYPNNFLQKCTCLLTCMPVITFCDWYDLWSFLLRCFLQQSCGIEQRKILAPSARPLRLINIH